MIIAVVAVAVVAVAAVGAFALTGGSSHEISYELNGGTNNPANPSDYTSDVVTLYDPSKDGCEFDGWFLESSFKTKVTSLNKSMGKVTVYAKWSAAKYEVTYVLNEKDAVNVNPSIVSADMSEDLKGASKIDMCFVGWFTTSTFEPSSQVTSFKQIKSNTTLYAKWSDLVGTEYSMKVQMDGGSSAVIVYRIYDQNSTGYLVSVLTTLFVKCNVGETTTSAYGSDWIDYSEDEFVGLETIDTIDGRKELFVYKSEAATAWVGSNGVYYKQSNNDVIMTLESHSTFEVPTVATIKVFSSDGVTVNGAGTYKVGDKVKLTATATGGKKFAGFTLDANGTTTSGSVEEFIATDNIAMYALAKGEYAFYNPGDYSNPSWVITDDATGKVVKTVNGNPAITELEEDKSYTGKFTGTSDGKTVSTKMDLLTGTTFVNNYSWYFDGYTDSCKWDGYLADYAYYKNYNTSGRHHIDSSKDSQFVTYTDSTILSFRDYLEESSKGMTKLDRANYVLRFVQENIEYTKDSSGKGMNEYWKYPYETLYDMRGDCEDSAILYAALMKSLGYEVALILYDDHMATGIGMPSGTSGTYYEKNGVRYYYCETTATGWWLGDIPSGRDTANVIVIS